MRLWSPASLEGVLLEGVLVAPPEGSVASIVPDARPPPLDVTAQEVVVRTLAAVEPGWGVTRQRQRHPHRSRKELDHRNSSRMRRIHQRRK